MSRQMPMVIGERFRESEFKDKWNLVQEIELNNRRVALKVFHLEKCESYIFSTLYT